jgi:hypothetical protein
MLDVKASSLEVVVQQIGVDDDELRMLSQRSIASRTIANRAAREATDDAHAAVKALREAGVALVDAEEILGLSDHWDLERRRDGVSPYLFDETPWLDPFDDGEESYWNQVDPWSWWSRPSDPAGIRRFLAALGDEVGGAAELVVLDDEPLPDEEFVWDDVPSDLVETVAELVAACDIVCDAVFDVETRTACRRLLAALVRRNPKFFRRPAAKSPRLAAAVCWVVGKGNHVFSTTQSPRIKEVAAALGVSSPGDRAHGLLRAGGLSGYGYGRHIALGSADFLVAAHRRRIIELRDLYS